MAKRIFSVTGFTFTATSDSVAQTNDGFMGVGGPHSSAQIDLLEVYWGGLATTSAVTLLQLVRTVTPGTTTTALVLPASDGPEHPSTAPLVSPTYVFTKCTANPVTSNSIADARLNLAGNTFGGIVRWNAAPTQQWTIMGSASPGGCTVLKAGNMASGANAVVSAHILYEPY